MEEKKLFEEWKPYVHPALQSKADEFKLIGYQQASSEDVWKCLKMKVWKKEEHVRLHKIVQDILHLGSTTYISYITASAYEDSDLQASIDALKSMETAEK